jgi:diguanylate cyclase (GGDEF)-like protein
VVIKGRDSIKHWRHILVHKKELSKKINRPVGIRVAALDYFDIIGDPKEYLEKAERAGVSPDTLETDWTDSVFSHSQIQERLKQEMNRAKRYKHSLSLILIDIDEFHTVNEKHGFKIGDIVLSRIIKIVNHSIRTVDSHGHYAGDKFIIVLPDTNRREASELAERIRKNVEDRSGYIKDLEKPITISSSVIQLEGKETASTDLIQKALNLLQKGRSEKKNFVFS